MVVGSTMVGGANGNVLPFRMNTPKLSPRCSIFFLLLRQTGRAETRSPFLSSLLSSFERSNEWSPFSGQLAVGKVEINTQQKFVFAGKWKADEKRTASVKELSVC